MLGNKVTQWRSNSLLIHNDGRMRTTAPWRDTCSLSDWTQLKFLYTDINLISRKGKDLIHQLTVMFCKAEKK